MKMTHKLALILGLISSTMLLTILMLFLFFYRRRMRNYEEEEEEEGEEEEDIEASEKYKHEELVIFQGGEDLTICDVLEASGEVIGKSNCGTLYKASLQRSNSIRLLRFLRPICCAAIRGEELEGTVRLLGEIRHPNLVPLLGFYTGTRGEKLLVHPFYACGNLAQFIRGDGNGKCYNWFTIFRISYGIAKGLEHLHTAILQYKPIIHGNLKTKNILLDRNFQPYVSDYGLHLLLNPTASQQMLEASAYEGYKAPELIKMKDASEKSDIYSLGVILLELLSGKEPIIHDHLTSTPDDEDFHLPSFMRNAQRISDMFHPAILIRKSRDDDDGDGETSFVAEECILKCFELAMACCSPSPSLRPNIKQVLWKLEEIVR
ncbi:putative kinase-like protein TMKL1 [Senna tora]|uniref:Putative kinase-like protein TMKL1 n=1 Tax=Senna tora TaxID=362788 RepID=A0A835CAD3_9FABA|nr:putative kinase-like protein TMKL1 [Senna tora]